MPSDSTPDVNFYIGLSLALLSTLFIGCSFIVKKIALRRLAANGTRAGDGGLQYLCDWVWWFGLILMGIGEGANFAGYAFAPASLVTPMGGLSVLVSAVLSSHFLGEDLNFPGKIGCVVCLCGSTMVVLHAPKEQEVQTLRELSEKILDPGFLIYTSIIIVAAIISIFLIAPRFGQRNPLVFVFISGSIGSLSVMACKGIGLGIKEAVEHGILTICTQWVFWFFLLSLTFCLSVQLNYLNRALDIFNTSVVTPLLYVFFTAFVLIASAILFKEGNTLTPLDYIGNAVGLTCIVSGIALLTLFKDLSITLRELLQQSSVTTSGTTSPLVNQHSSSNFREKLKRRLANGKAWCKRSPTVLPPGSKSPFDEEAYVLLQNVEDPDPALPSPPLILPRAYGVEPPRGLHQRTPSGNQSIPMREPVTVTSVTENGSALPWPPT
ncbi:hypothetical protein AAHC03_01022 [Spirometra sp. Aus1]